ncbi:MAG: universal stress protein [Pseudomonadota bacterium]
MKLPNFTGPVVIPIDFSPVCLETLKPALAEASWPEVHVIHVARSDALDWEPGTAIADAGAASGTAAKWLADWVPNLPVQPAASVVRFGDAGREVIQYAAEIDADAIIVPSRGRTGLEALRIGSVAERIIRLADRSVLVLNS